MALNFNEQIHCDFNTAKSHIGQMATIITPSYTQMLVLQSLLVEKRDRPGIIFLNGNRGGGKSFTALMAFLMFVGTGLGNFWNGEFYRRFSGDLASLILESHRLIPKLFKDATFNKTQKEWTFSTGETLKYKISETKDGDMSPTGSQVPFAVLDELTLFPSPEFLQAILSAQRTVHPDVPTVLIATSNATGEGKNWVNRMFQLPQMQNEIFYPKFNHVTEGEVQLKELSVMNVELLRDENTVLKAASSAYDERLLFATQSDRDKANAWVKNVWGTVDDTMFGDYITDNVMIDPFYVPESWKIYRSMDYGQSSPFAILWHAVSDGTPYVWQNGNDREIVHTIPGDVFLIYEWYGCDPSNTMKGLGLSMPEIGKGIHHIEKNILRREVRPGAADLNLFTHNPDLKEKSLNAMLKPYKATFVKAYKGKGSRITGWGFLLTYLKAAKEAHHSYRVHPCYRIFNVCSHSIRTLRELQKDEKNPDDCLTTHVEDHIPDAIRYFLTSQKIATIDEGYMSDIKNHYRTF
jgi:hypothetical protein